MKEKLLEKGYKVWKKSNGEERIYINNIIKYLTITKSEKSSKHGIDIYEDSIEDIQLNTLNINIARDIKDCVLNDKNKLYYDVENEKFCWKNATEYEQINNIMNDLIKIVINKLRKL